MGEMRRAPALLAVVSVVLAGHAALADGPAPPAPPTRTVVLWRLASLGLDAATAGRVTEVLRAQLAAVPGFTLVPKAKVDAVARQDATLASCTAAPKCAAKVGRPSRRPGWSPGSLSTVGDARSLDLRLVDVATATVKRRVAESWTGGADSLLAAMRTAATKLLAPKRYQGRVALTVSAKDVKVYLDGDYLGRTPMRPFPVSPGRHALRLAADGYPDFQRFVDVAFGTTVPVKVSLKPLEVDANLAPRAARGPLTVGASAALLSNLRALSGPGLMVRATWGLRLGPTRLELGLAGGVYGGTVSGTAPVAGAGDTQVAGHLAVYPVALRVGLNLLPQLPFSPYVALEGGAAFAAQSVAPAGFPEQRASSGGVFFAGTAGVLWRLGPGALNLSLRLQAAGLPTSAVVPGPLAGLGVTAGYVLFL